MRLFKERTLLSQRGRAEGEGYKATSPTPQKHTLFNLSKGYCSGNEPQKDREAHTARASQVREGHESDTSSLDMSVAVNVGLGALGPFFIRGEVSNPF